MVEEHGPAQLVLQLHELRSDPLVRLIRKQQQPELEAERRGDGTSLPADVEVRSKRFAFLDESCSRYDFYGISSTTAVTRLFTV